MSVRHGDLEHVIVPLISIDEFAAKTGTDQEVVVVTFFLKEEMAAHDLDEFIDKGVIHVLDSEVSPNPNEDGHWLVFVEVKRQRSFWSIFEDLIKDVQNLTNEQAWRVQAHKSQELYALDDEELRYSVPLTEEDYIVSRQSSEVAEYFEPSALDDFSLNEGRECVFTSGANQITFELAEYCTADALQSSNLMETLEWNPMVSSPRARALERMLGEGWNVTPLGYKFLVEHADSQHVVILA